MIDAVLSNIMDWSMI